jgi:hypothetical protein
MKRGLRVLANYSEVLQKEIVPLRVTKMSDNASATFAPQSASNLILI